MASIPSSKITLSYPIYGADFDPIESSLLLVGGGGGEGRSGVGNKITLLSASKREELSELVEIDLSRNEDSVTSLAIVQASGRSLVAFAGINSSEKDQDAGKNEHLRSFRVEYPSRTAGAEGKANGTSQALSKTSYFKPSTAKKKETYQRVLRLSPWTEEQPQRIAAISTSLAPENEIVVFRAATSPSKEDELARISLGTAEAADLAIRPADPESRHLLVYCTDDEVYTCQVNSTSKSSMKPTKVYSLPSASKQKFRSVRFLTPRHLLLLRNLPSRSGADLLVLKLSESTDLGTVVLEKRLRASTKVALSLDVCVLSSSSAGERQIVVAVAGQDLSIEIFTLEYSPNQGLGTFQKFNYFRNTHPASITSLRFSNFIPPPTPVTKDTKPQVIRLASTSVSQTVVVHTLPLRPYPPSRTTTPRYVLRQPGPSEALQTTFSAFMALLVLAIAAIFLQAFTEIRGGVPPILGAAEWLPPRVKDIIARPYMFSPTADLPGAPSEIPTAMVSAVQSPASLLSDLLLQASPTTLSPSSDEDSTSPDASESEPKAIIVRDDAETGISATVHPEGHPDRTTIEHENLQKFEDLQPSQQEKWKKRLVDAGHWAENQGETILKGVFFGEVAGLVGAALRRR